jgi:hypothetical protein
MALGSLGKSRLRALVMGIAVAYAASESACSSDGKPSTASAAGSGGAGGDSTGVGGATTGGATTGGATTGGSGGAVTSPTPLGACQNSIRLQCQRRAECDPSFDFLGCLANMDLCPAYFFTDLSTRTVEGTNSCAEELRTFSCTDLEAGALPPCVVPGTATSGCRFPSQCENLACNVSHGECGYCSATLATRANCRVAAACPVGDFCSPGNVCQPVIEIVHAAENEACDRGAAPMISCEGDLICTSVGSDAGAICRAPPPAGEPCLPLGDDDYRCDKNAFCDRNADDVCVARAAIGEACSSDGGESPLCELRAYCDPSGICRDTLDVRLGQPCERSTDCWYASECVDGVCRLEDVPACDPFGGGGAPQ